MKKLFFLALLLATASASAQVTVSPSFPTADEEITIVYDATQGTTGLVGASQVMMHAGVVLSGPTGTGWQNVQGEWGNPGSVGSMTNLGNNKWQIKITPRTYFQVAAGVSIYRIGMVFRSAGPCGGFAGNNTACKEGKTSGNGDFFVDLYEADEFSIDITEPAAFPVFKNNGEQLPITASVSESSDIVVKINGATVATANAATTISHTHTITEGPGTWEVSVSADNGDEIVTSTFKYIVRAATINASRPAGIIDGINYDDDDTKVTLSLWAPAKTSVYAVGDFSDWEVLPEYQMKKAGEHFWLEIDGLTPGQEYGYQYLVNETLKMADPYADKILDPDDHYIPDDVYPNLKAYPDKAQNEKWYFNRVAVFQTNQTPYDWQVESFEKPAKEKLVVYELLIRDFFGNDKRSYQSMIDTIGYFKRLGVNAIELMPIMEFAGNDSWGYNPTFMFAPDKYYGPKDKFKEFVDVCHQNGIAVILDIAMNHHDMPNPYVMMDFDFVAFKPSANNKWFNTDAKHPFNVFFDMNHESLYTKAYLDTVNYHWLNEYKVDGFRFDLSKGFTQVNNPNDVNAWSSYDPSRIAILKRMADKIWTHSPDAYVILEHLSVNSEEKELAEYRAGEGKGMMLWGNMNYSYNQNTLGFSSNSDISNAYYTSRNWTVPHLVSYMESHDEERLMYRNLTSGNSSGGYNVKNLNTGLARVKAASVLFYTLPGPKMLWQFGELGYDVAIDENGRTGAKPVKWEYYDVPERRALHDHMAELIELRNTYDVFTEGTAIFTGGNVLQKQITLKNNPYTATPADATQMNVQLVANFELTTKSMPIAFPHTGTWYDYYDEGKAITVTTSPQNISLPAGAYKMYTDVAIVEPPVTGIAEEEAQFIHVYPNPTKGLLTVKADNLVVKDLSVRTIQGAIGKVTRLSSDVWDIQHLADGLYIIEVQTNKGLLRKKIYKGVSAK
jgi:1,4-alpha-glucan branching enzyme